jgi:hypothetical protein
MCCSTRQNILLYEVEHIIRGITPYRRLNVLLYETEHIVMGDRAYTMHNMLFCEAEHVSCCILAIELCSFRFLCLSAEVKTMG